MTARPKRRVLDPGRPKVPDVLPLARALYASPGGGVGCCLHIALDDGNLQDGHLRLCLETARERGHAFCAYLASQLLLMSPTQRGKVYKNH